MISDLCDEVWRLQTKNRDLTKERKTKTQDCVRCRPNVHYVKETHATHVAEMNEMKRKLDMNDQKMEKMKIIFVSIAAYLIFVVVCPAVK